MDFKEEKRVVEKARELRVKDVDNLGDNSVFLRADMIDFKTWDVQLEKHLSRAWSRDTEARKEPEEWEIDLAKLDIKNAIAHGTYGTVYKGVYDCQDVAVKVLEWGEDGNTTADESDALQASFRQEVAVWHKLDHPNVTKFIGASIGTTNLKIPCEGTLAASFNSLPSRACCVVVEYIAGGTLKKFLIRNSKKKLAFRIVVQLALDLARGLSYLHSKKIVHRDVKTENMLLDVYRSLKIADFGVARVEAQNPRDMTGNTGTLGYMAPEVLDVEENLRPEIGRCCPTAFANIMRKCWDAKPENRPEMEEVVKMLEAVDTSKGGGMIADDEASGCFCFRPTRGP